MVVVVVEEESRHWRGCLIMKRRRKCVRGFCWSLSKKRIDMHTWIWMRRKRRRRKEGGEGDGGSIRC
jgi:hypothetical protein